MNNGQIDFRRLPENQPLSANEWETRMLRLLEHAEIADRELSHIRHELALMLKQWEVNKP